MISDKCGRVTASEPWRIAEGRTVPFDEFTADPRSNVFIQWKGTSVCFDFYCDCGTDGHFDGYFAYEIKCRDCGAVYAMPSNVCVERLPAASHGCPPVIPDDGDYE